MTVVRINRQARFASILVGLALVTLFQVHTVSAGRYYAVAKSGAGTTTGTGAYTTTWSDWNASVGLPEGNCTQGNENCAYGGAFTDEAVWIWDTNCPCDGTQYAIEAGFGSGYAPSANNPGWQSGVFPYFTLDDGVYMINGDSADDLPGDTYIWMADHIYVSGDGCAAVQVDDWVPSSLGSGNCEYGFTTPRLNYTQGETLYGDDYMGGGSSGESFTMYFQPLSGYPNNWNTWGQISCEGTEAEGAGPYGYNYTCNQDDADAWWNGGTGNGDLGS